VANPEGLPFIHAHPSSWAVKGLRREAPHDGKPLTLERVSAPAETLSIQRMNLLSIQK